MSRETMQSELDTAETLLAEAEVFADNASSGNQNASDWYDSDRTFQSDAGAGAKRINLRLARLPFDKRTNWDAVAFDVSNNLVQSESFLYGAVADAVASCNESDAHANLRVAKADIKEARRDLDHSERDPEDWSPPEIQESGENDCQH